VPDDGVVILGAADARTWLIANVDLGAVASWLAERTVLPIRHWVENPGIAAARA
jgi:hypothetical protein